MHCAFTYVQVYVCMCASQLLQIKTLILMAVKKCELGKTLNIMAVNISGFTVTIVICSLVTNRWHLESGPSILSFFYYDVTA